MSVCLFIQFFHISISFHTTNNSFSVIPFIACHKWNSKDNAVTNERGRNSTFGSQKSENVFCGCLTFPLAIFPNVQYKCKITALKETDGGEVSWRYIAVVPRLPVPVKKSSLHHPRPRLLLLIHVHEPVHTLVHMVGLRLVFMWPHLHLFLMPKHRGDMFKWI